MRTIQKMIVNVNVEMWIQHEGHFQRQKIKLKKKREPLQKYSSKEKKLLLFCFIHTLGIHVYWTDNSSLHCPKLQGHLSNSSEYAFQCIPLFESLPDNHLFDKG